MSIPSCPILGRLVQIFVYKNYDHSQFIVLRLETILLVFGSVFNRMLSYLLHTMKTKKLHN